MSNATEHSIRALPIYVEAFSRGRDLGLKMALDVILAETIRQDGLREHAVPETSKPTITYAQGVLGGVARQVAAMFRQGWGLVE